MKIWKKRMVMLLMLLCLFLMAGLSVSAAGSRVLRLRNGRTYRADLDGNGKKEKIQLQYYTVGDNCFRMRIYINGRLKLNTLVRDSLDCIWEVKACLLDYNRIRKSISRTVQCQARCRSICTAISVDG